MDLNVLLRNNIKNFKAYSSARDEYSGSADVFLDANENPNGSVSPENFNRYPDPYQRLLKTKISGLKKIAEDRIFLGNGSDEAIDLLFRAFCNPGKDSVLLMPPTYGMYAVCANLSDAKIIETPLTPDFQIDLPGVLNTIEENTKLVFICSPNNPSANVFEPENIKLILKEFDGLVIIDEAYIDFSSKPGWLNKLTNYPNLVILQTFSKAWGMANLRLGMAFADPSIIKVMNAIKYPYNVNGLTQQTVLQALNNSDKKDEMVTSILKQRTWLAGELQKLNMTQRIFPSEANFLLARIQNAKKIYNNLLSKKIIVRDRSSMIHCQDCLRITVGTGQENQALVSALRKMDAQ